MIRRTYVKINKRILCNFYLLDVSPQVVFNFKAVNFLE